MTDISKLRALHAAATPGTWVRNACVIKATTLDALSSTLAAVRLIDDAAFMVAAHAEWNGLLDEVERFEESKMNLTVRHTLRLSDWMVRASRAERRLIETTEIGVRAELQLHAALTRAEKAEAEVESLRAEVARLTAQNQALYKEACARLDEAFEEKTTAK